MRVSTNSFPNSLLLQLQKLQAKQVDLQKQLSSGQKIDRASDNPTAVGEVKEAESIQRQMISFRRNLDRADLITDYTMQHAEYIRDLSDEALKTSAMLNVSSGVADMPEMLSYANLVNNMLEQTLDTGNAKNGDEYIFSGSTVLTKPFEANRDADGTIAAEAGISKAVGQSDPVLKQGQSYRIDNNTGVNFTDGGAPNNNVGTIFTYDGNPITWGAGGPAALTALADTITETDADKLVVGQAYEIVGANTGGFTNAGASSNNIGTQFIYNGTLPTSWNGAELAELEIDDTNRITTGTLTANRLYYTAGLQYNGTTKSDFSTAGSPANLQEGDFFVANGAAPTWGSDDGIDDAVMFGYKRKELAVQYVGSDARQEFTVAKDTKISPYNQPEDNKAITDLMNAMVKLRDAYLVAADANDEVDERVAVQKIKDAANALQRVDDGIVLMESNLAITQMNLEVSRTRDNMLFEHLEDRISREVDIDEESVVTNLMQAQTAMDAALASGARIMSQSLLDYI